MAWIGGTQALVAVSIALLAPGSGISPTLLWAGFVLAGVCAIVATTFATVGWLDARSEGGDSA